MLVLVTFLLIIILFSRITEESLKIPATLSIIIYAFALSYFFPNLFVITHEEFDEILYLMLPVILLPDILNISIKELRENMKEIFYLAFVAVVISIVIATFITPYLLPQYQWSIGMLIALFSMLMATDAITVSSIMSKFKLPEKLKIYAESESLFNDVTALIIFYFIALPLIDGGTVSVFSINLILLKVISLSVIIGVITAFLGYVFIKILKNPLEQLIIIYLVVITSFLLAEHFHIAGILSIVAAVVTFKLLVQKELHANNTIENEKLPTSLIDLIKSVPAITKREFREYKKEAMFIGIFANSIVFIVIANIIYVEHLLLYYKEILLIFLITSVIRYGAVLALIKTLKLPSRWTQTLTLAGSKGALAIIMSHSLPQTFIYKNMFVSIVIGNVLLSTFIYTFILMYHIYKNKSSYEEDILKYDESGLSEKDYVKSIVNTFEKEHDTNAYNKTFIEDIFFKEISRAQRYKINLSVLTFKISQENLNEKTLHVVGEVINKKIRIHDYFGKISQNQYIILASNTSLSGAIVLAQKIADNILQASKIDLHFGVTQMNETDTSDTILDKLDDALERATLQNGERIEVEV